MENQRAETGVMQFDNDWPGVFIRGDNALMYAIALRCLLDTQQTETDVPIAHKIVEGLATLLESSDTRKKPAPQKVKWCPIE